MDEKLERMLSGTSSGQTKTMQESSCKKGFAMINKAIAMNYMNTQSGVNGLGTSQGIMEMFQKELPGTISGDSIKAEDLRIIMNLNPPCEKSTRNCKIDIRVVPDGENQDVVCTGYLLDSRIKESDETAKFMYGSAR